jgi:hypothetical protein
MVAGQQRGPAEGGPFSDHSEIALNTSGSLQGVGDEKHPPPLPRPWSLRETAKPKVSETEDGRLPRPAGYGVRPRETYTLEAQLGLVP